MIKLNQRPLEPSYLRGQVVSKIKQALNKTITEGKKLKSNDFKPYWLNKNIREPLWNLHNGKCCYCERKRWIKRESDIEHYRPKAEVTGEDNHPGYWWLAYEWTNYLFSCKPCNEDHKRNHFPLLPGSSRAAGPNGSLSAERPVLLNPIDDEPESCISYDWWTGGGLFVKALGYDDDDRGSETIKILGLNDDHLMKERAEVLTLLQNLADSMLHARLKNNVTEVERLTAKIRDQTSAKRTFAGFKRAFFKARELGDYLSSTVKQTVTGIVRQVRDSYGSPSD